MNKHIITLSTLFFSTILFSKTITVQSGQSIQSAVDKAAAGDTIEVQSGKYLESVFIDKPNIRLVGIIEKGKWPLLDGGGKRHDGVIASGSGFQMMNFHVRNYRGNGVTTQGADNVVLKNLVVQSTGIYGIYPTHGTNILVENTVTSGIADAGIYVSLCHHVDVRRNEVFENVSGIEVENSHDVLVENNFAHDNSAGIMAFTLPGLPEKTSNNVIIRNNIIESNNHPNFANPGAVVGSVPRGTGIIVLAGNGVIIEGNMIRNHLTAGIIFSDMEYIEDSTAADPQTNPRYDNNQILSNFYFENGTAPEGKVKLLLAARHFRLSGADIIAHGKGQGNCIHPSSTADVVGTKAFTQCKPTQTTSSIKTMLNEKAVHASINTKKMSQGERIYRTVCSGCHASGIVLIGPSVQAIQKKYLGNPKGIAEFAYAPNKIRSKFPEMPSHSYLGRSNLEAVANYILELKNK